VLEFVDQHDENLFLIWAADRHASSGRWRGHSFDELSGSIRSSSPQAVRSARSTRCAGRTPDQGGAVGGEVVRGWRRAGGGGRCVARGVNSDVSKRKLADVRRDRTISGATGASTSPEDEDSEGCPSKSFSSRQLHVVRAAAEIGRQRTCMETSRSSASHNAEQHLAAAAPESEAGRNLVRRRRAYRSHIRQRQRGSLMELAARFARSTCAESRPPSAIFFFLAPPFPTGWTETAAAAGGDSASGSRSRSIRATDRSRALRDPTQSQS